MKALADEVRTIKVMKNRNPPISESYLKFFEQGHFPLKY